MHAYIHTHTEDCRDEDCFIIMCTCMRTSRRLCVCIRKCIHTYIHTQDCREEDCFMQRKENFEHYLI